MILFILMTILFACAGFAAFLMTMNAWSKITILTRLFGLLLVLGFGVFFINNLAILASVKTTAIEKQTLVSPKDQALKDTLHFDTSLNRLSGSFFFMIPDYQKLSITPKSELSNDVYQLLMKNVDPDEAGPLDGTLAIDTKPSTDYLRLNNIINTVTTQQKIMLRKENIHINNPKRIPLNQATFKVTKMVAIKKTQTNTSKGFLKNPPSLKTTHYDLILYLDAINDPTKDKVQAFFDN